MEVLIVLPQSDKCKSRDRSQIEYEDDFKYYV